MHLPRHGCRAVAIALVCAGLSVPVTALAAEPSAPAAAGGSPRRPNIVVVMTDDQTVESLRAMPHVRKLLVDEGVSFDNSVVSFPLCCPSRATYLTGQYAHNHHVRGTTPPFGGYAAFTQQETTFPAALQRAGYTTVHIGKYLNGYGSTRPVRVPPGWSDWHGSLDPTTYQYFGFTLLERGKRHTYGTARRDYQTDVYTRLATSAIRHHTDTSSPLFLNVAYLAPHAEADATHNATAESAGIHLARPAARYAHTYDHTALPKPPAFDEHDVEDKPDFVRTLPRLTHRAEQRITKAYRAYLGSLRSVDDGVQRIINTLEETDQLRDTVVIFTSDNGFFFGEHRIAAGKTRFYEPSIDVPLVVRGPGIAHDVTRRSLVANIDLAPTILALAHATPLRTMDGTSLVPLLHGHEPRSDRGILLEARGVYEPDYGVRTQRYAYIELHDGVRELYDLRHDPDELHNRSGDRHLARVEAKLASRLHALVSCAGESCRDGEPSTPAR